MVIKIVRILILAPVLIFLAVYGFDALLKRLESKKFEEETRQRMMRRQILEKAQQNRKALKWAKTETSPEKIRSLKSRHGKNIEVAAIHHRADPKLVKSIILVESGGNEKAVSSANAIGLMGIKPIAAKDVKADPKYLKDPFYNLLIGSKYLGSLKTKYRFHRLDERLLAYNRGPDIAKAMLSAGYKPQRDTYVQKVFLALEKMN